MMSVPVMSDGMRSGVNWMRRNCEAERVGDGAHHQCFRRARHAGQQAMAADEDGDQDLVEHFLLADDHLAHLLAGFPRAPRESARCAAGAALRPDSIRQNEAIEFLPRQFDFEGDCCNSSNSFCAGR